MLHFKPQFQYNEQRGITLQHPIRKSEIIFIHPSAKYPGMIQATKLFKRNGHTVHGDTQHKTVGDAIKTYKKYGYKVTRTHL